MSSTEVFLFSALYLQLRGIDLGRIRKGELCGVIGCNNQAVKSLSYSDISLAQLSFKVEVKGSKVYLCKRHYREFKKAVKKLKRIERWRISPF